MYPQENNNMNSSTTGQTNLILLTKAKIPHLRDICLGIANPMKEKVLT